MARTSARDDIQADNPFERDEHGPVSDATSSSAPSAQDELREAIKRCERFLPGHGRIGMRAELERLVQAVPDEASWQEELGALYLKTGDLQKARVALEAAARLAPTIAIGHYQLGLIYTRLGLQDRAHEEMEQYQKLRVTEDSQRKGLPVAAEPATAARHSN